MIIHETDNLCVDCSSMGLSCNNCKYSQPIEYDVIVCSNCKEAVENVGEYYFIVDGEELCVNCAFEQLFDPKNIEQSVKRALEYIDSAKDLQVDFYLNWLCKSSIVTESEKVSDIVIDIIKKECLQYPNMLYDDLKYVCAQNKDNFVSFFYEREEV